MDYEKNKEALAVVKQMIADGQIAEDVAAKYFPELTENADEKTRKFLCEVINRFAGVSGLEKERLLAWIEKHGGQPSEWSEEDAIMLNDCICAINAASEVDYSISEKERLTNWLKSLCPQKRWKPSEKQIQSLEVAAKYYMAGKISCKYTGKDLTELLEQLRVL